jgi:hypothetical protein
VRSAGSKALGWLCVWSDPDPLYSVSWSQLKRRECYTGKARDPNPCYCWLKTAPRADLAQPRLDTKQPALLGDRWLRAEYVRDD